MEIRDETGITISQPVEIDFDDPEQAFLTPTFTRLKHWLRRANYSSAKVVLKFDPAIYIFSQLTYDDRDSGVYNSRYIDSLIKLSSDRPIKWSKPIGVIDRKELRPVPDDMYDYLRGQSNQKSFELRSYADSFLQFISARSSMKIFTNDNYNLFSAFGESEEEFLYACRDLASIDKSEAALEQAAVVDRELQQVVAGMRHDLQIEAQDQVETRASQIEAFEMACKRMMNKAVSLNVLDPQGEESASRSENYSETLRCEANELREQLERYEDEFRRFSDSLIERFTEIELNNNEKADGISVIEIPPSSCRLELLRISLVWLPGWSVRATRNGVVKDHIIKAF